MVNDHIKMLEREKEWYEKHYHQFNHSEEERKGFINGIEYCLNLLIKSKELSGPDTENGLKNEKILNASNIQKIEWDESNLIIHFQDAKYQYFDIPEKISIELGNAESPGSYLHREIKGKYRYARID